MKNFLRAIFAIVVAMMLAAAVNPSDAAPRHHARAHAGAFDGSWSVGIYTTNGSCGSYRAAVRIYGGRVSGGDGDYSVYGSVSANGAIRVGVRSSRGTAFGSGRLSRSSGAGHWRTSTGECSGQWTAERRG